MAKLTMRGGILSIALTGLFAVLMTGLPAAAEPADAAPPAKNCILIAQAAPAGGGVSPLKQECGDAAKLARITAARTQLMTWYADAGFKGLSTPIYGDSGPCDKEGYQFDLSPTWWSLHISSYRLYANCYWSSYKDFFNNENFGHLGDVDYVGDHWNDNIAIIRTWAK